MWSRRGCASTCGHSSPEDLEHLSEWVDDPSSSGWSGSEFLNTYKHVYDKDPSFYEACLTDPTQVVLVIEANPGWDRPLGLVRLFNIHLLEGYAFLETILTDSEALQPRISAWKQASSSRTMEWMCWDSGASRRRCTSTTSEHATRCGATASGRKASSARPDSDGERYWDMLVFGILQDEIEAAAQEGQDLPSSRDHRGERA